MALCKTTIGTTGVIALALTAMMGLGLARAAEARAAAPADPASVLAAFEKTVGLDVDAGLAMMADDAVLKITPAPQGTTGLWTGKDEIRQGLQYSVDHKVKREIVGAPQVDGTKATDTVMTTNDFFQMIGVAPVQFSTEAVVEGGKIRSFVTTIAPSEQGRVGAAAKAFQAAHAAPAPTGMPQTGANDPLSTFLPGFLLMALCLVTAGFVLRRSRSRA